MQATSSGGTSGYLRHNGEDAIGGINFVSGNYVRQALFSRSFDNDDLLQAISTPVLISHGAHDAIVKPAVVDQHNAAIGHAQSS